MVITSGNEEQNEKNITREQIISATLNLIEQKQGREGLTIREISRNLGCSHPNIYNYYSSLDNLLWDVLELILETMMEFVLSRINSGMNRDEQFQTFISGIVTFSLNNTGWYKLLWFEDIKGDIPEKTAVKVKVPSQKFAEFVLSRYPEIGNLGNAVQAASIIHSYMHGEISKYITHRNFRDDREILTESITQNSFMLLKMLIAQNISEVENG